MEFGFSFGIPGGITVRRPQARAVLDAHIAPFAGIRQLLRPQPGESRGAAFMRGVERRMLRPELEAFRTEDGVLHEIGRAARFHATDGAYRGDAAIQAEIGAAYSRRNRIFVAAARTPAVLGAGAFAFGRVDD